VCDYLASIDNLSKDITDRNVQIYDKKFCYTKPFHFDHPFCASQKRHRVTIAGALPHVVYPFLPLAG